MTKDFENTLKKLRITYRREANELSAQNENAIYSETSSSILESYINFDEENKEDDVPLLS
jgi:hypothetical protein